MYLARVIEHTIVNTLLVFRFIPTCREYSVQESWEHAFDGFYDAEFDTKFGNLLNSLGLVTDFPPDSLQRLRSEKVDRDHRAHRFLREHDTDFLTSNGRAEMITECERLISTFQNLDHELEAFAAPQRERFGITQEALEREYPKMMSEAKCA